MPKAGIQSEIPRSQKMQSYFLSCVATGIGKLMGVLVKNIKFLNLPTPFSVIMKL